MALPKAQSPFSAQISANPVDMMRRISDALSAKADVTLVPTYDAVILRASDGSSWKLTVTNAGLLATSPVART